MLPQRRDHVAELGPVLDEVAGGATGDRASGDRRVCRGREDHDGRVRQGAAQRRQRRDAVEHRKLDVEHDRIRGELDGKVDRLQPVAGQTDDCLLYTSDAADE